MRRSLLLFILLLSFRCAEAQVKVDTTSAPFIDTAALLSELHSLLDSTVAPVSYGTVGVGIGNRLFSLHNNQLNAKQAATSTLVFTPSVAWYHKSGFNIAVGASLLQDAVKGFGATQYSLSPGYNYSDKSITAGISYTHYFIKDYYSAYSSPVQHDWYGTVAYKKTWLQPGLALGYSRGNYKQVRSKDTVVNNIRRFWYDSMTNHLRSFTFILNVSHSFDWEHLLAKDDAFELTPSLMLNMGASAVSVDHKTNLPNLLALLERRGKLKRTISNSFQAESIGLSIDGLYNIGNFSFNPQLYLDYYLPASDSQRFTQVFTISMSYMF